MKILLNILKIHLITVYFFIKLIYKQKYQVCFLSRQSNELSINYELIIKHLEKENIPYKVLIKKINSNINDSIRTQGNYSNSTNFIKSLFKNFKGGLSYYFSLYKQMRYIASSKVVIIDGYSLPVCLLKHKKGTKIIQMWHALGAIKKFGYESIGKKDGINPLIAKILKMHNNYNYVISGSESMNKFFAEAFNIDEEKVIAIGTPTIDYLLTKDIKIEQEIYTKYPILKEKTNILYSPTFRNDKRNGLKELIENFDFNNYNLILTSHPKVEYNYLNDKIIIINPNEFNTYDILKISDYVITDYSALIMDALVINKKILLYVYDYQKYKRETGLNINLLEDYPNITKTDAQDIVDIIINNKYNEKEYQKFANKYKPKVKNSISLIINLIKECLNETN